MLSYFLNEKNTYPVRPIRSTFRKILSSNVGVYAGGGGHFVAHFSAGQV